MLAVLRPWRNCHLKAQYLISQVLKNSLETCYQFPCRWYILYTTSWLNPVLSSSVISVQQRQYSIHQYPVLISTIEKNSPVQHKQLLQFRRNVNFKRTSLPDFKEGSFGSRYCPPSTIERAEAMIKESLNTRSLLTYEEWHEFKVNLMDEIEILSDINFSSIVMNCLLSLNKVNVAHSFMDFLKEIKMESNFLTYLKYMDLCGRNIGQCKQEVILETFHKVQAFVDTLPVLDLKTAEHLVRGLCSTDQWQLSLKYLKKVPNKPNMGIKNSLACAAIRNGDEALAWEIITKWLRKEESPDNHVFKELFKHASLLGLENHRSEMFFTKVLQCIQHKGFIVNTEVTKQIEKFFQGHSSKWHISYTKVSRNGECEACKRNLKVVDLSAGDFIYLRESFLERSLKKTDLFINTTEKEFNQYLRFIDTRKPYDIVLDGLNAAYSFPGVKSKKNLAVQLLKVVESLSRPSRRLLVLGKQFMSFWPKNIMTQISKRADVFLTSDVSQDDPFMVYAALVSGPNTNILTLDLMRDHLSRLDDPKLIRLFKRWQQTHQILLNVDDHNNIQFMEPLCHSINVQGNMAEGWHIPFDDNMLLDPYEELNNWLCVQKKQ